MELSLPGGGLGVNGSEACGALALLSVENGVLCGDRRRIRDPPGPGRLSRVQRSAHVKSMGYRGGLTIALPLIAEIEKRVSAHFLFCQV